MTRRELLLLPGACSVGRALAPSEPRNFSFPLQSTVERLTPWDLFFVREHFPAPEISPGAWRLKIEGRVRRRLEISLPDLIESPTRKLEAVLECATNVPGGTAVSNAVWEGVPFTYLLTEAGAASDAVSVLIEGADTGRLVKGAPQLSYTRVVPVEKCLRPESLVAFKMNDRFLPRKNGQPARALFPGWYGVDSIKWLQRIVVLGPSDESSTYQSSGMSKLYNRVVESVAGEASTIRITEMQLKSVIAWPGDNWKLPAGKLEIRGFAWTGKGLVRTVSLSADAGRTWTVAQIESHPEPFAWVPWKCAWQAAPGDYILMSRAVDDAGREQPLTRDPSRKDAYELNFCAPIRCRVR